MCVFICPGTRPAVGQSCVCGSGGDPRSWNRPGPVLETWGWTEAICWVVWGVRGENKEEREREKKRCVCTKLLDILLCASAGELYE